MNGPERDPRRRIDWRAGLKLSLKALLIVAAAMIALEIVESILEEFTDWELDD